MRRRWLLGLGALLGVLLICVGWFAWSARAAYNSLTSARDQLVQARSALVARDIAAAEGAISQAAASAHSARGQVDTPIWSAVGMLPRLGDSPQAVRDIATALDQVLQGLAPAATALAKLDPAAMIRPGGKLDLAALQAAVPLLSAASTGVQTGLTTLAGAPQPAAGAMVMAPVAEAQQQLTDQLDDLGHTLASISSIADIAPPLLGASGPKRYFFALLNPNESRPGGGFLGTWAVVRADQGQLTVQEVGSNTALPNYQELPIDLGAEFENRYGSDPALIVNSNLSPHFPNAARLWLTAYAGKTGQALDGVIAADVVALGNLLTAAGQTVELPDGSKMDGDQLTRFALVGVYEKYPEPAQAAERKLYQEAVAKAALQQITAAQNAQAMVDALAKSAQERRVMLYTNDAPVEEQLLKWPIGGSLAVPEGPQVLFATLNIGANKMDAFLHQEVNYEVGRCPDPAGRVRSQVTVELVSRVPKGQSLPHYISGGQDGDSATNAVTAQLHLPMGAEVTGVYLDGEPTTYAPFTEQGRPSLHLDVALPARAPVDVEVYFTEPASPLPAKLVVQPLADEPETEVEDLPCG